MRNHREENGDAADGGDYEAALGISGPGRKPDASDLVFDLSDLDQMRVQDLMVLLTARKLALEDDRTVWAAGASMHTWRMLNAMGLGGYFKRFPTSEVEEA